MYKLVFLILILTSMSNFAFAEQSLTQQLQNVSFMVETKNGSGSGVVVTRELKIQNDKEDKAKVNFILTAGHVIDDLRLVRTIIDPKTGSEKKIVEFKTAHIIKQNVIKGRKVGELRLDIKVIKYSHAETGQDLAVLQVLEYDAIKSNTKFYLKDEMIVDAGTRLFHVGSMHGEIGYNSFSDGVMSSVGRIIDFNANAVVFDKITCPHEPGSSGGGVFLAEGENKGELIGLVVRGGSSTFGLTLPIRRMHKYLSENNLVWLLDEKIPVPSLEDLSKIPIEDGK